MIVVFTGNGKGKTTASLGQAVRAVGRGTRIDVRSASRYGAHDLGTNAKRVAALLADIDDAMSDALTEPPRPEPKKKPQPPKRPARR